MTDNKVVRVINWVAEQYNLTLEHREHGGKFRTVYLSAHVQFPREEQRRRLERAFRDLKDAGISSVELTRYDNPPYRNKFTGQMDDGHPRHGDPVVLVDSVWWEE